MNSPDSPTILMVDDQPLFGKRVVRLIQAAPEFGFVGGAANGKGHPVCPTVAGVSRTNPEVLDFSEPALLN